MSRLTKKAISPRSSRVKLSIEQTIGTTSRHNSCIAVNSASGEVAYASGCVVVLFNPLVEDSQRYLSGSKPKSISCLAFSQNGKFLAVGESGYQPCVLIFDVSSGKLLAELMGHRCGVSCVQFDPSCKYLISVGFIEDKFINVWDWRDKQILAINKVANKIYALDFGEDGTYFVTSGVKHLKIWYLTDVIGGPIKKTEKTYKGRSVLEGKMVALGEKQDCTFMDVVCAQGDGQYIFAVTEDGFLIQVDRMLGQIGKWVNMKTQSAFGLSATPNYISVACTDGISRVFNPENLQYVSTLPKPAATGYEVSASGENQADRVYPDVIGIKFVKEDLLLCLYSNRSIILWDIQDFSKVEILYSFLAHSACIWDLVTTSNGTFVTASADKTIKFWNLEAKIQKTPFSKELVKSLSICENYSELKMDNQAGSETSFLGEEGIRCLAVSPDERHLASGDRTGNLRIHDLDTYECVSILPAHDTEILSLAYSCPSTDGPKLLASGSRDRLVHIFQRSEGYDPYSLMATLDDHTSTVTSVKFAEEKGSTKLISTSTDKSILFRKISESGKIDIYHRELTGLPIYDIELDPREASLIAVGAETKISSWDVAGGKKTKSIAVTDADSVKGKLLKVDIDPSGQFVVTSSQDRFIRLYDLSSGQMISKVTGHSELITGLRFTKDCTRIISVSGDGCIFIWRLSSDLTNIMQKKLAEIQDQIPRFTALSLAKSQKLNRFTFDHSRLPMWAQRSFLPKNSELLVTRIAEPKFRGAWTPHIDSIALVHNALLQLSPKTVSNKVSTADLFTHRSLKGCATPGRLRAAASKKSEIQQFQIDNQILNINQVLNANQPSTAQEPPQGDESDDGFTSVSEDNPPDFMEKNYDFTANFLPNEKPKNKNRLTLSGKFFTHPTSPIMEGDGKENMTANANQSKNSTQPKKATNWMEEIELAKRKMIEMEAGPTETITTANLFANPTATTTTTTTTKKYGFFDLLETKGTNLTPSKNPLSNSEENIVPTPQKIIQTPTKYAASMTAEQIIAEFNTPTKVNSVPTTPLAPTQHENIDDLTQTTENEDSTAEKQPIETEASFHQDEKVEEKNESEATTEEEINQTPRDDDLATTELYINNLKNVFDQSISLYCQLISREGRAEGKERMILGKFQDLFSHMRDELEEVMPSEQKSQQMLLENYSEMLVSLVKSKLS